MANGENQYFALIKAKSTDITSININNNCKLIADQAFSGCGNLTTVSIPESVTSIGTCAFSDGRNATTSITSITIPKNVANIGIDAFRWQKLTEINVDVENANFTSIDGVLYTKDGKTLVQCPRGKIGSFSIPSGVTNIGDYAFSGCSGLKSITLPESITNIGEGTFDNCGLASITIPESVTNIGARAFSGCIDLKSIIIPKSVTNIGADAFSSCIDLKSIIIPKSVTNIGAGAFSSCSGLTSITIPESVTTIGDYAFSDCSSLTSITIPESVINIGVNAFSDCSSLTSIIIPEKSVTTIGDGTFRNCSGLTSVTIPSNVENIDGAPFSGVPVTSINVDADNENYTSIDGVLYTIDGKTLIEYPMKKDGVFVIPSNVTSIGENAFLGCTETDIIIIPENVTSVESGIYGKTIYCQSEQNSEYTKYWSSISLHNTVKWNCKGVSVESCNAEFGSAYGTSTNVDVIGNDNSFWYSQNVVNPTITLTASPNEGYHFVKWTSKDEEDITENPITLDVTASKTYTAVFETDVPTLVSETEENQVIISVVGQNIIVGNAANDIYVYDVAGRPIAHQTPQIQNVIAVGNNGVYFVTSGDAVKKVVIK